VRVQAEELQFRLLPESPLIHFLKLGTGEARQSAARRAFLIDPSRIRACYTVIGNHKTE
jgi:hypothetical protein